MHAPDSLDFEHTDRSVHHTGALARAAILVYGIGAYLVGVAALVGLILTTLGVLPFTGGPVRIEHPALAALFNAGWLVAFAVQHSAMARATFKARWIRVIHPSMERSTYVLATGVVLLPLLWLWQPLPTVLWSAHNPILQGTLTGIAILGWSYLFVATFAIDHFELFGLQQVFRAFRGEAPASVAFQERWMYRFDRHPIMTGLLIGMWVTPTMTAGHLLLAVTFSAYVIVGVHFEERAMRRHWGATYDAYRRRVPAIVPLPWS